MSCLKLLHLLIYLHFEPRVDLSWLRLAVVPRMCPSRQPRIGDFRFTLAFFENFRVTRIRLNTVFRIQYKSRPSRILWSTFICITYHLDNFGLNLKNITTFLIAVVQKNH